MATFHPSEGVERRGLPAEKMAIGEINRYSQEYQEKYEKFFGPLEEALLNFRRKGVDSLTASERESLFLAGLNLVENCTPGDPTNPPKRFLRDLRIEIGDTMELAPELWDNLRIYSAVGTPLDIIFGADIIVTLDREGAQFWVTLDHTLRDKNIHDTGADIIVPQVPDHAFAKEEYLKFVADIARQVARMFLRRQVSPTNKPYK